MKLCITLPRQNRLTGETSAAEWRRLQFYPGRSNAKLQVIAEIYFHCLLEPFPQFLWSCRVVNGYGFRSHREGNIFCRPSARTETQFHREAAFE